MVETKFKIRKYNKKFELQFERANVWNQWKFMNGWNTSPNQSNMQNSYFCVKAWMKFCCGTNFIQHHPTWFFLLFWNFINFAIAQTIPRFHLTWQKRDFGWNIRLVCSDLKQHTKYNLCKYNCCRHCVSIYCILASNDYQRESKHLGNYILGSV